MSLTHVFGGCCNVYCPYANGGRCTFFQKGDPTEEKNCSYCSCHESTHVHMGFLTPDGTYHPSQPAAVAVAAPPSVAQASSNGIVPPKSGEKASALDLQRRQFAKSERQGLFLSSAKAFPSPLGKKSSAPIRLDVDEEDEAPKKKSSKPPSTPGFKPAASKSAPSEGSSAVAPKAAPAPVRVPANTAAARAADRARVIADYAVSADAGSDLDMPMLFSINGKHYIPGQVEWDARKAGAVKDLRTYCFSCLKQLACRDRDTCCVCDRLCFVECGDYKLPECVDDFGDTHYVDEKHAFHCCVCTHISLLTVMHRDKFASMPSRSSVLAAAENDSAMEPAPAMAAAASAPSPVPAALTVRAVRSVPAVPPAAPARAPAARALRSVTAVPPAASMASAVPAAPAVRPARSVAAPGPPSMPAVPADEDSSDSSDSSDKDSNAKNSVGFST